MITLGIALVKADEDDEVASLPALPIPLALGMAMFALVTAMNTDEGLLWNFA